MKIFCIIGTNPFFYNKCRIVFYGYILNSNSRPKEIVTEF